VYWFCAGVLVLQNKTDIPRGKFKTPYVNSKFILPVLIVGWFSLLVTTKATMDFIMKLKSIIQRYYHLFKRETQKCTII
jgi:hypothetical protein